jgi:hypothetical protein
MIAIGGSAMDIMTGTMIGAGMVGAGHAGPAIRHAADQQQHRHADRDGRERRSGRGEPHRHVDEAAVTASARPSASLSRRAREDHPCRPRIEMIPAAMKPPTTRRHANGSRRHAKDVDDQRADHERGSMMPAPNFA